MVTRATTNVMSIVFQWNKNNKLKEEETKLIKDFEKYWKDDTYY